MNAALYVLSGVTQPILMAYASHAGLADPRCQLYMLFYYIGPALVAFTLRCRPRKRQTAKNLSDEMHHQLLPTDSNGNAIAGQSNDIGYGATSKQIESHNGSNSDARDYDEENLWPSGKLLAKAAGIALFDIFAQSMVYTGNNLAGPTIFSIIYSSVTIWAAIFSKILLSRSLVKSQWMGVCLVVVGLSLTAMDSLALGNSVFLGACLVFVGSAFHGMTYVMCEKIMTPSSSLADAPSRKLECGVAQSSTAVVQTTNQFNRQKAEHLSIRANCATQGIIAMLAFLLWQLVFTLPHLQVLILAPMAEAGTTALQALTILTAISIANLLHSVTYFTTLKYFPGGATSAGVLKGLQAVLVFAATSMILCGRWGGIEMCWSEAKFYALVVVVGGILLYGINTEKTDMKDSTRGLSMRQKGIDDSRILCV